MSSQILFLSVQFTSSGGFYGGFSYLRSTSAVPEPSLAMLAIAAVAAVATVRAYRRKGWLSPGMQK